MDLLEHTSRVSFELSNRCNYAHLHKHCPLYPQKDKEPIILSTDLVYRTLQYLYFRNFKGVVAFHVYNEPLLDPRLFYFIKSVPQLQYFILTNGAYLTQQLADDLDLYISKLVVSVYSEKEEERLKKIKLISPYQVVKRKLDDRLDIYDRRKNGWSKICHAPLNEIIIGCDGKIRLCCLDWKGKNTFGSLYLSPLSRLLEREEIQNAYKNLSMGKRVFDICQRCRTSR